MAKFKVGDKVRVRSEIKKHERHGGYEIDDSMYAMRGKITTVTKIDTDGAYSLSGYAKAYWEDWMVEPAREFIVIHRSGNVMTAEHRVNRDVIKSAKATCSENDTFDFDTGAKLAFDRLMGREADKVMPRCRIPESAPQPAHRFKVGDRVVTSIGAGYIKHVDVTSESMPYYISYDSGVTLWHRSDEAKPEPPKFYTGKVFAIKANEGMSGNRGRVNRVFEVVNGIFIGDYSKFQIPSHESSPFKSFDEICERLFGNEWREVKE